MADAPKQSSSTPLGIYDAPRAGRVTGIEITAAAISLLWLVGAVLYFLLRPVNSVPGVGFMSTMMAIFLPVAMVWVAATAAKASRVMREESARLQAAIDAIRQAYIAQSHGRDLAGETSVVRKLEEIAEAARNTESALATFQTSREGQGQTAPPPQPSAPTEMEAQPVLALGTQAQDMSPPLSSGDLIRALNFPETAEDEEGFAALRRAMRDRTVAQLVTAAQDVLTLLSQDGIYMDDLRPDRARPEIWRQFALGARGRTIAALGGIRDRSSLALSAGRMKQDPIFRDAAHHFLRKFDQLFSECAEILSDEDIALFADTRTARAFMLLGRVAGTFD